MMTMDVQGSQHYASINQHLGVLVSRAANLESASYALLELLGMRMPWLGSEIDIVLPHLIPELQEAFYCEAKVAWLLSLRVQLLVVRANSYYHCRQATGNNWLRCLAISAFALLRIWQLRGCAM